MFNKLPLLWRLLQNGSEVMNKEAWKRGQAYLQPIIAAFIMTLVAIAKTFGYDLPIDDSTAMMIGGAVFFAVNTVLTIITSKSIGISTMTDTTPAMYSVVENPSILEEAPAVLQQVVVNAAQEVVQDAVDDGMAAAKEWLKRHAK